MSRRVSVFAMRSWADVARDYPRRSTKPGVVEFTPGTDLEIHSLLWYDDHGKLRGIFNYYPKGTPAELPGEFNITVQPEWRRRGIATELLDEAFKRWPINLDRQVWTNEGAAFITAYEEDR